MSRLGYITKKFADAEESGETPDLNSADLRWCAEWERWDLVQAAGYDPDELREQMNLSKETGADPFNTSGVPRVGSDREMRMTRGGRVVTIDADADRSETPEDDVEDEEIEDYNDYKVEELRAELKRRQLPADGNKDVLVQRLEEDDEANAADDS
jgi:hypothetical protein